MENYLQLSYALILHLILITGKGNVLASIKKNKFGF